MTAITPLDTPAWLTVMADAMAGLQSKPELTQQFRQQLQHAIQPGADLRTAGSTLVLALLDDLAGHIPAGTAPLALTQAVDGVRALHRACLDGAEPLPADWKAARRLAINATDSLSDPHQKDLGQCAETAAWNPARSSSCVYDTMRVWRGALNDNIIREFGWTDADDKDMETTLKKLHEEFLLPAPHLKLTVFDLLEEHHPEKALRLREYYRHQREGGAESTRRATNMLLGVVGSVPGAGTD